MPAVRELQLCKDIKVQIFGIRPTEKSELKVPANTETEIEVIKHFKFVALQKSSNG